MSYDIKNKIPSLLKPGIYISGSDKELGLDTVDLEVFSIGSWQTDSLSSRYIVIDESSQDTFELNQANIDDVVIPTAGGSLPTSQIETLFGFAYTEADESTSINITDKMDLLQQINNNQIVLPLIYDHSKKPNEYNITSPPVKIKFGIEHYDEEAPNFANALSDDNNIVDFLLTQLDQVVYEDMVVTEEVIDNTSFDVSFNQWTLRYPNFEGPQNFDGHDITIKYKFEMGSYTNTGEKSIGRPAVQFEILFNDGINANNLLRIMNKVKIYNGGGHPGSEYKITSIKPYSDYYPDETNDLKKNKIGGILLDKTFPFGPEGPAGRGSFWWEKSNFGNTAGNRSNPSSDLPPFDAVYDFDKFRNEYNVGQTNEPPLPVLEELGAGTGDFSWTRPGVGNDMYLTPVSINNSQIAKEHDTTGRQQGLDDLKESGMWDMYWRNPHGNPHAREDDDDVLFNGNGAIIKILNTESNDMMFGDPSDTETVNSDIFPNPVTTLGQAEPSIKKISGKFIFKNKGSSNDPNNNGGLHKFLPTWQSGLNLWKDSNKTDLNGATWYLHTGQWDSSFEPHGYINANMNLPHGYNLEAANRTGIPDHSSTNNTYGIRTVGGQADANTSRDHDLPTIQPHPSNSNHVRVSIKNDSKIQIYGREVLTDVPRSGVFRVIVLFEIFTYQRPSTHELKLSVGVKTTGQEADLSPTRTTEPIPDDAWTYSDSPASSWTIEQTAVGEYISSNLFTTTPSDSNDTDPTLNLDVVLEVDMKGFYKNSVGDTNQDSWPTDVGVNVSNRDYYRGCRVNITNIELQPIDIALLSTAAQVAPVYKYKVLQWGDEKTLLTDEQLMNSFYLNFYNQDNPNIWDVKKYLDNFFNSAKYIKSDGALNLSEHIYNVPGIKSIKTIVFRTNSFLYSVDESKIITTNIMINDGLLLAQDFSIFGGSEFNFLPLKTKDIEEIERPLEAIIGGLDEDSKYNTSAEKIRKDDNFIQSDYLERVSARDYVRNFNNQLYGKSPGQLDLGIVRVFKRPKDIYDFIGGDKLEIISDGLDTLPVNSSATDIFINNDDCLIDINPENSGFLTIQNSAGMNDKAILIGDYKLNQPKDGPVSRDGNMRTPSIEKNKNKQAF